MGEKMAGINQLLPFANGEVTNVISYDDWNALAARLSGFQSGIASSQQFNYILAQGGAAGYVVGQMVADYTDETATIAATPLYQAFKQAIAAFVSKEPIIATGSVAARSPSDRFADVVNIKDFGAKGDGQTDDSNALSLALGKGYRVFFPDGTYVLDEVPDFSKVFGSGSVKVSDQVLPCGDVVSPISISYPGVFDSFASIFSYLSFRRLSAVVTISVASGTFDLTEQITHTHPDGAMIQIIGQGTTESVLRFTLQEAAGQSAIKLVGTYELGLVDNLTLDGNDWAGYSGGTPETAPGNPQDPIGVVATFGANVTLGSGCKVYRFARNGVFASYGGTILAQNVEVEGTGSDAFCATQNGTINCNGSTAEANYGVGFYADYGGVLWAYGVSANNTKQRDGVGGIGLDALYGGVIYASNSTITGTVSHGVECAYNSTIYMNYATVTNSGRTGVLARASGTIHANNANVTGSANNGFQCQEKSSIFASNVTSNGNTEEGLKINQQGIFVTSGSPSFKNNGRYGINCYQEGRVFMPGLSIASVCSGNASGEYVGTIQSGNNVENSLIYADA